MSIVDFIIIFCLGTLLFMNFCYSYQRNFVICDDFLFGNKKRTIDGIEKNIRCFEKKIAHTDTKIEKGFVNDTFTNSVLNYYIMHDTKNTKTLLFFHGNRGSIDRHLDKCFGLHTETRVNILIFDYAGYGKSTGTCRNDRDMFLNSLAIYEKVYSKNFVLKNTQLFIYGISLGTVSGLMLALYLGPKCKGVLLENSLFSINYLLKKSKRSVLNLVPEEYIRCNFSVEKYLDELCIYKDLNVFLLCSLHDRVISHKNTIKLYETLKNRGMSNVSYLRFNDSDIGHTNAWKFGKVYFDIFNRFLVSQ